MTRKRTNYQLFCHFVFKDLMTVGMSQEYTPPKKVLKAIDIVANYVGDISFNRIKPDK